MTFLVGVEEAVFCVLYTWAQVEVVLLREAPSDGSHPVSTDLRVKPHTCSST